MLCRNVELVASCSRVWRGILARGILRVRKQRNLGTENGQARCWAHMRDMDPNLVVGGRALEDRCGEFVGRLCEWQDLLWRAFLMGKTHERTSNIDAIAEEAN